MADAVGIQQARSMPGVRLLVLRGVPSPWSQAALGILRIKGIEYTTVQRTEADPPEALFEWNEQRAFPALMVDEERPRTGWAEILLFAEAIAPEPALIPADPTERALMFGLSHEICGEMGLGWARRLGMFGKPGGPPPPGMTEMAHKYGSTASEASGALARVLDILRMLDARLAEGRLYLMGDALSAVDVYWATFCNLVSPLPEERMPMADPVRKMMTAREPEIHALVEPRLLALRDRIYEQYLELPVKL